MNGGCSRFREIAAALGEYLPVILFAAFLAPTRLNTLRGLVLPAWLSPYHILAVAVAGACLWMALRAGRFSLPPRMLWMPMLGLGLVISAGLWWTDAPLYGRGKVFDFWALTVVGGLAPWYIFEDEGSVRRFFNALIALAIVLSSILLLMSPPWEDWYGFNMRIGSNYLLIQQMGGLGALALLFVALREDVTVREGFAANILLGTIIVLPSIYMAADELAVIIAAWLMGLGITYWWLGQGALWGRRAPHVALLIAILAAVLHAGGKGPVLSLVIAIVGLSTLMALSDTRASGIMRWRRLLAYMALLAGVMGIMLLAFGYSRFVARAAVYFDASKPAYVARIERLINIEAAWGMIKENPILGAGLGSFSAHAVAIPGRERMNYPHNIIIEALAEEGIIGAGLVLVLVGYAVWILYRLHRRGIGGALPLAALGCLVFVFLCAQTSQDINNVALFGLVGLAHAIERILGQRGDMGHL